MCSHPITKLRRATWCLPACLSSPLLSLLITFGFPFLAPVSFSFYLSCDGTTPWTSVCLFSVRAHSFHCFSFQPFYFTFVSWWFLIAVHLIMLEIVTVPLPVCSLDTYNYLFKPFTKGKFNWFLCIFRIANVCSLCENLNQRTILEIFSYNTASLLVLTVVT